MVESTALSGETPPPIQPSSASPGPEDSAGGLLVVGIGASAGGLEACIKLLKTLPASDDIAFVLVQHLDPTHESMMVDLLARHTSMKVVQAADGMLLQPNHFYVIPPGTYLSVGKGALHVSEPQARHGARLPFDYFLHSLADAYGRRAACVVLSGTGADGSLGLRSVKEHYGLVVAQNPDEAAFDGMPRSAILSGVVDLILPVAEIPDALAKFSHSVAPDVEDGDLPTDRTPTWLHAIIELLHARTGHDLSRYKRGTLQRRIERRMAIAGIDTANAARYLDILRGDSGEIGLLAKDLYIHVTSFFRDPAVFDLLAAKVVPDLIEGRNANQPIRIWVVGCSTGEETYSIAMLFHERMALTRRDVKLQIFASDVDTDAIIAAREGIYPKTIEADVSAERLSRYFVKLDSGYRVSPELRASVVFTVQDVLVDPPFSRLDLISCRNLLIYLRPDAQLKVISLFHFALQPGGVLLLGSTETVGHADGQFEPIDKSQRLYRHVGHRRSSELVLPAFGGDGLRILARPGQVQAPSRQSALADLCRRMVIDAYAPAAVLINRKNECLFSLGPIERYLRMPAGHPTYDLLAMVREDIRIRLRSAIQQAVQGKARAVVGGNRQTQDNGRAAFDIEARPVSNDGEDLLLICFVDRPAPAPPHGPPDSPQRMLLVGELEQELDATRAELQAALRNLEISSEEQRAINEEALSVNEEFQSTNEELVTSKEELQSLNEELTALNSQLQETLERQRATGNDLQNVLYSTNIATIFLDRNLRIRFFTPATKSLFNILTTDIGRPLADLNSLAIDTTLLSDAATVLFAPARMEREIETSDGTWFLRRILPYRTDHAAAAGIEGVVITFADITDRRHAAQALELAKRQAEMANVSKSRFLAAASHDLRQPLQTLMLLQGALELAVSGERAQNLVKRFDQTLTAMTEMLNTLLDINQIEAGVVRAEMLSFPMNDLLGKIRAEFADIAQTRALSLHVLPCSLWIHSDPRLLEQMIRNLMVNALKYTKHGKILLGCRRRDGFISIEVWDTGIGIPATELHAIFDEYHQLDNAARERSRGLGLGLAIVQRLANLLGHRVGVRSRPGKGSVFTIEVSLPVSGAPASPQHLPLSAASAAHDDRVSVGNILIVEDDPEMCTLLDSHLSDEGYRTTKAADGVAALELVARGTVNPDLILADFNLPNGLNGLRLAEKLRKALNRPVPVIILTGDISIGTLRDIALRNCVLLHKPVKLKELEATIRRLLLVPEAAPPPVPPPLIQAPRHAGPAGAAVIFVVDDDAQVRAGLRDVLEGSGHAVQAFATGEAFFEAYHPGGEGCLLIDAYLPGVSGLDVLQRLNCDGHRLPSIMITGSSDVPMAVQAMRAGAMDFIEKPVGSTELLASVARALEQSRDASKLAAWHEDAAGHLAGLTERQREIMDLVLAGHPSKNIAADLGISQRTVENHRAAIMHKTGAKSLPALARLALAAARGNTGNSGA